VAEPARLMFWRAKVDQDVQLKLAGTGSMATIDWKKGSGNRLWPIAELPVATGSYTLTGPDGVARKIDLVVLPSVPTEVDELAGTLIENGCENQLGLLVETMAASSQAGGTSGDQ
jgi:hypothetical protein